MRVAVIGGKLQGVETTYLAHKAGWEVILIDKNPDVPARGLCDFFRRYDVTQGKDFVGDLKEVELVVPALENREALACLQTIANHENLPLAYDSDAYAISCSKIESNKLFSGMNIARPLPWPAGHFPLVIKPSGSSGSEGVRRIDNVEDLQCFLNQPGSDDGWVIEEFLDGPSYSIEVIGHAGEYETFQVTDLEMDEHYDCKRVLAPTVLPSGKTREFEQTALAIARRLELKGIMDVEVILHNGTLKVLEIDARLPSQTPTVVYLSKGINMVERLGNVFGRNLKSSASHPMYSPCPERGVVYEHLQVSSGILQVSGEHIMSSAGPLKLHHDFFGADEAISNYATDTQSWVATLIVTGGTRAEAWEKRCHVIDEIIKHHSIGSYTDPGPAGSIGPFDEIRSSRRV